MKTVLKGLALLLICLPVVVYIWGAALGPYDWRKFLLLTAVVIGSISLLRAVARLYVRNFGQEGWPAQIDRFFRRYHGE